MGRNIKLDFRTGGGAPISVFHGVATLEPTSYFERGSATVLDLNPYAASLAQGKGTFVDVHPTPEGPVPGWCYRLTVTDREGRGRSFLVGVPTGNSDITFNELPRYEEVDPATRPALADLVTTAVQASEQALISKGAAERAAADAAAAAALIDAPAESVVQAILDERMAGISQSAPGTRYIYVDSALGSDVSGLGDANSPYATIQRACNAIPKLMKNDHYIMVKAGTYPEEARLQGVGGAAVTIMLWGDPPTNASESTGMNIRALAFYDIGGRVVVSHVNLIDGELVTKRAQMLFSRVDYATVNANRATSNTKNAAGGAGVPSIEFDGSAGSVGSNHFDNQFLNVAVRNGSSVRLDVSNTQGAPSSTAVLVEAATAYKAAATLPWTSLSTAGETTLYGGVYLSGWATWSPSFPPLSGLTFGNVSISHARYNIVGKTCHFVMRVAGTTTGTPQASLQFTLPVPASLSTNAALGNAITNDNGFDVGWMVLANSSTVQVRKAGSALWSLGVDKRFYVSGTYEIA